jgi:hypothetical protein
MALSKITTESLLDGEITLAKFANLGSDGQVLTSTGGSSPPAFEALSAGKVLQVVQTHDTTARSQTGTNGGKTVLTGLAASITPSATSSKILISARWNGENGTVGRTHDAILGIQRGGTDIGQPSSAGSRNLGIAQVLSNPYQSDEAGSTMEGAMFEYLDSPSSTSSLTYNITYESSDGAYTLYTNRSVSDSDATHVERLTSTITLWEISA